jgi:hypothetical protein
MVGVFLRLDGVVISVREVLVVGRPVLDLRRRPDVLLPMPRPVVLPVAHLNIKQTILELNHARRVSVTKIDKLSQQWFKLFIIKGNM